MLVRPARFHILVATLVQRPILGHLPSFDLGVVLAGIPLARRRHDARIHDLALARDIALLLHLRRQLGVQRLEHPRPLQPFTETPYRPRVRHPVFRVQAQEAAERVPVPYLVLRLLVAQVVQLLQYQNLEHQDTVVLLATRVALARFGKCAIQRRTKPFPIHHLRYLHQRIAQSIELREAFLQIEKSRHTHRLVHLFASDNRILLHPCQIQGISRTSPSIIHNRGDLPAAVNIAIVIVLVWLPIVEAKFVRNVLTVLLIPQ